jgi:curved DNA-binding protein CbpA
MEAARTDAYAILGLTPRATQSEITHAYRALLRRHHPDTRGLEQGQSTRADDAALQDVLTAYDVLRDPARRAEYDRLPGMTGPPNARVKVHVHTTHPDPTLNPPIQAGPVRWHRQPEP